MENKRVIITGGTGLVGKRLSHLLESKGYEAVVLSRAKSNPSKGVFNWDISSRYIDAEVFKGAYALVHLAGAGVADKAWTNERKKELYDSRIDSTNLLVDTLKKEKIHLKHIVSASAIGYYGFNSDQLKNEDSSAGNDFLAGICKDWESAAEGFQSVTDFLSITRIGIVLDKRGGALKEMALPVSLGLGSPLGSGKQVISWIHYYDLIQIVLFLLEHPVNGVYNAVAPQPVSNGELMKSLANAMRKPYFMTNVPSVIMRIILGSRSQMVLGGLEVSSHKIQKAGYTFSFPTLNQALNDFFNPNK